MRAADLESLARLLPEKNYCTPRSQITITNIFQRKPQLFYFSDYHLLS